VTTTVGWVKSDRPNWLESALLLTTVSGPPIGMILFFYLYGNPQGPGVFGVIEWVIVSAAALVWLTCVVAFFAGLGYDTWGSGGTAGGP
jgi:hypothetical protein